MHERRLAARVVSPLELDEHEIAAWERLCAGMPGLASPFLGAHYARAVATAGMEVRVCVIREGENIRGFFPYQFASRFARWNRSAEPVGGAMSDYFGLVAEPGVRIAPKELLRLAGLSFLNFTHLDESQLGFGLCGEQPRVGLRIHLGPSREASAGAAAGAKSKNGKYLKDTDRRLKQLSAEVGDVAFEFDVSQGRHEMLDRLIRWKREQYRRTGAADALAESWKVRLLHELAQYPHASCRGVLSTLSAGGRWIASHFGLAGNGVLQYWLPVYHPELSRYAPGRLLLHRVIDGARQAGLQTVDRGEGDTPAKRETATGEHLFYRGAWRNDSLAGRLAQGAQSIKWRLGI